MEKKQSSFPVICFGESFWTPDLNTPANAGAPVNLSFYLKKLGITPLLLTRVGLDEEGKWLIRFLEECGIHTDHFQVDYELPTGNAYPNNDSKNTAPGAWTNIHWEHSYESLLTQASFVVHTSRPACRAASSETLDAITRYNSKRIVHLNLEAPFFNKTIVEKCLANAYILQLTQDELSFITGWFTNLENLKERVGILQEIFKIPYIIVVGKNDKLLLSASGHYYEAGMVNHLFNADAFLAAFIFQLLNNEPEVPALNFAYAFQLDWPVEVNALYKPGITLLNNI